MLFVPLWLCTVPAVLSVRCRLYSQNNRPVYECLNVTDFGLHRHPSSGSDSASGSASSSGSADGIVLPSVPRGTMTFRIAHTRIDALASVDNSQIVTLALNYCGLRSVARQAFANSTNLRQIDLSHNLLTHLDFEAFGNPNPSGSRSESESDSVTYLMPQVERVILSHNLFETIPDLSALVALRDLDISHNLILDIAPGSLLLPRLDWIDLSHNALTHLEKGLFGTSLRVVSLDGNPWQCDCKLRHFVAFQRQSLVSRSLRCREPIALRGVKWDDLALSDFACGPYITAPLQESISVSDGESVTLSCLVEADPTPSVVWRQNTSSKPILSGSSRTILGSSKPAAEDLATEHTLTMRRVRVADADTYWCVARAGYNTVRKRFHVSISPTNNNRDEAVHFTVSVDDQRHLVGRHPEGSNEASDTDRHVIRHGVRQYDRQNTTPIPPIKTKTALSSNYTLWLIILCTVLLLACLLLLALCIFVCRSRASVSCLGASGARGRGRKYFSGDQGAAQLLAGADERSSVKSKFTKVPTKDSPEIQDSTFAKPKVDSLPVSVLVQSPRGTHIVSPEFQNSPYKLLNDGTININDTPIIAENVEKSFLLNNEVENDALRHNCMDQLIPKAPLAQYDRDTCVLPLVQTSL